MLDALVADIVEVHGVPNASRARIAIFAAASRAADVVARVGLGVAETLGLGERLRVGEPRGHLA